MAATEYKVQSGDTLSLIARQHHVTVDALAYVNGIKDIHRIQVGQSLRIPEYKVKQGDTLSDIARAHHVTVEELAHANNLRDIHRIQVGQLLRIPPGSAPAHHAAPAHHPAPVPHAAPAPHAAAAPHPASAQPRVHKVRPTERLPDIARNYGLSMMELLHLNDLIDPRLLWVGQELKLPHGGTPSAKPPAPAHAPAAQETPSTPAAPSATAAPANSVREVAFAITGAFEGGKASSYQTKDKGIVSYGKHQATLASGTLGLILDQYLRQSHSAAAKGLAAYKDKVARKDESLRKDATFKKLLLEAAEEPLMNSIQDSVFAKTFWPPAEQGVKKDKLQSPLALAMYYDTNIQGGLSQVRTKTADAFKGKSYSETEFLTEFNRQRDLRLQQLAKNATKKGDPGTAEVLEGSRVRVRTLQKLVAAKDLQLKGDAHGVLFTHNGRTVRGLGASAPAPSKSTPASTPATPPASGAHPVALTGSVGKGGQNSAEDVRTVQTLLNANRPLPLKALPVNGRSDAQLVSAITQFQQSLGMKAPDGRVDPGGATLKALNSQARSTPGTAPMPWESAWPTSPAAQPPVAQTPPSGKGHGPTLTKLGAQARKRFKDKNLGACARGVSEMLHAAGYSYAGGRPCVYHGLIDNKAYDYSTGTWVSGSSVGYYVFSKKDIGPGGRVAADKKHSAQALESARFFSHTLRMIGFADATKLLPGDGRGGTAPKESVQALRALPEGAVIVFGPALNRSVEKKGDHYVAGGHGHAGHVGILAHEGSEALVVADGLLVKGGARYTVESCLQHYAWAIGFLPKDAPRALSAKDRPKQSPL